MDQNQDKNNQDKSNQDKSKLILKKEPTININAKEFKPKGNLQQNFVNPYSFNNQYGGMDQNGYNPYYMNMYNIQGGNNMNMMQGNMMQGNMMQGNMMQGNMYVDPNYPQQQFYYMPNTNQNVQGNQTNQNFQGNQGNTGNNLNKQVITQDSNKQKTIEKKEVKKDEKKDNKNQPPQNQPKKDQKTNTLTTTNSTTTMPSKKEKDEKEKIRAIEEKNNKVDNTEVDESKEGTIVEVDETLKAVNIVFIGHVDSGKSTIAGNILYKTGMVDERTIEKFQKEAKTNNRESWFMAYIMDMYEDERQKGKTAEVGKAFFKTKTKRFTILDAPGHAGYIADMLKGASQADYAGLVISAKQGEFESGFEKDGRTREHALLARSLGVSKLICIVNKMDEESVKWCEERFNQIKSDLSEYLKKIGYKKDDIYWIPISGLLGDNLIEDISKYKCPWYVGPNFLDLIDNLPVPARDEHLPLRIPVLDRYKDAGMHVLGKIESGIVKYGQTYTLMPNKVNIEVSWIWNSEENGVRYAKPGEAIRLKIKNIENESEIQQGSIICSVDDLCPSFQTFEAEVQFLELVEHKPIICNGYMCVLHIHTIEEECTIENVLCQIEKTEEKKVKFISGYSRAKILITVNKVICAEKFDTFKSLGRFTLRDEGKTIGIGKILRYKKLK